MITKTRKSKAKKKPATKEALRKLATDRFITIKTKDKNPFEKEASEVLSILKGKAVKEISDICFLAMRLSEKKAIFN